MVVLDLLDVGGHRVDQLQSVSGLYETDGSNVLLCEVVRAYFTSLRRGNASVKTRSDVSGSTRKVYRQKGTGNARHGSRKAPLFVGGGSVWGPRPRDYSYRLPKSARVSALRRALSLKFKLGKLRIVEDFKFDEIRTKYALRLLRGLQLNNALFVTRERDFILDFSFRNIPYVKIVPLSQLNVFFILSFDFLVLTKSSFLGLEERFLNAL